MKTGRKEEKHQNSTKFCRGPSDPNYLSCNHTWKEFVEKGCEDNNVYGHCTSCGLICPIPKGGKYPSQCLKQRAKLLRQHRELVSSEDFEDKHDCGCN